MDDKLLDRARALREAGLAPKQIARCLGLSPSAAVELVRRLAGERPAAPRDPAGELLGCWVSPGWSRGLSYGGHSEWVDNAVAYPQGGGLVLIMVGRRRRPGKISVATFLVDAYCLGVKNAIPPVNLEDREMGGYILELFEPFGGPALKAPLELAQHLVFGAVAYARALGFEPHPDFLKARGHLGGWVGPSAISFGMNGRPCYFSGPYDDPEQVLATLEKTVGVRNSEELSVPA